MVFVEEPQEFVATTVSGNLPSPLLYVAFAVVAVEALRRAPSIIHFVDSYLIGKLPVNIGTPRAVVNWFCL